jgi:hypothetical protein
MMRRLSLLLALAVIVTTIMIVSVMPAMAKNSNQLTEGKEKARPAHSGNSNAGKSGHGGAAVIHQDTEGNDVVNKKGFVCNSCNND